jgi:hypothetical protein
MSVLRDLYSSSLCDILNCLLHSFFLGPYIFLNTLFSYTYYLCSSFKISDHFSCLYKTGGKISTNMKMNQFHTRHFIKLFQVNRHQRML